MTGEEYANLLSNIQKINKIEWVTKGDPWEANVCKIRVFADSITFDMIWGYPKYSAETSWYDAFLISFVLWKLRKQYGETEDFKPIYNTDELTKEINNCIKLLEDNGVSVNFNAEE